MVRTLDLTKKSAIFAAAKSIFLRDGYAAAKMSDIASEAKVAPGTLYLYFENKEALASAIGDEFFSRLITQFGTIIKEIKDPDGIVNLVDWALKIGDQERIVLAMVKERKQERTSKVEGRKQLLSQLEEALKELASQGIIRGYSDRKTLADLILAFVRRLLMAHAVFDDENTDDLKAGAIAVLQHALFDDVTLAASRLLKRKTQSNF